MSDQKPKDTLPSYTQLFGGMDFATGKHCRSVLSPAAYFVDLMQMKDDTNTEVEGKRRKDIDDIPLDCENTLTTIPYLDVVNEVLVTKAAADHEDDSSMDKDAAKKATAAKAYKRLAEAKYPLNLPFNLSQQRIADNLEYFNRDSLDLYKAFASSVQDESVQAKTAAREYLKLSSQEYELLAKEEITADSVKPYWGLESTENLSSLEDSTTFVNKSNLSGKDLQALLFHDLSESEITAGKAANFFINKLDAQPSTYITIAEIENEDSNEEEEKLQLSDNKSPLTARHYDRLHRFIRLARHLKWSFSDLDWVIRSACGYKLDASALQIIAVIKYLEENYRLPIEELCAFWADIKAEGHGEKSMPGDLYNRTFNNGYNLKISALDENDKAATKNRLMSAIELKEADYLYLHDQLTNAGPTLTLESSSLTLLYRFAKISAMLELTVKELFIVLEIVDQNRKYINTEQFGEVIPLTAGENHSIDILLNNNVTDTLWLLQLVSGIVAWLKDNAMSVKQLEFICSSKSEGHVEGVLSNDERRELFAELKGQFESILLTPAQLQSGITDVVIAAELLTQLSTFEQGIADSHGLILQEPNSMAIAELLKIIFEKRLQISEVDFAKLKLTNDEQNLLFDLLRKKKYTKTIAAQAAEEATGQEASDKIHQIVASQQLFDYFSLPENAETFHLGNEAFSTKEEEIFATIAAKIANYQKALASVGTEAVQVVDKIKSLAQQQQQTLYTTLENSFGLSYDLVKLIGDLVFKTPDESAQAVVTHFMQPILKAVDPQATKDAALMTSFRRLQQLLLLVAKAGLSSPEAAALFANQQTADKLPEKLKLPAGFPLKVDAAYQATNGDIYLFADESYVGYDLRLMSVDATTNLKDEGRDLVIVALVGTNLHIRIFDASGEKVVDKAENELIGGETLTALKQRLSPFPDE
ncbi:MAG: hypothetical protein GY927_07825, partial [bacterium]|nr:hypothetical protein [bacterium]